MAFFDYRLSQRERLMAERDYVQRLKHQKLARETLPHRETRDLLMGGQRVAFSERLVLYSDRLSYLP